MDRQPKLELGPPPGVGSSNDRIRNSMTIQEIVSKLRVMREDFDKLEEVLLSKEVSVNQEIGQLQEKLAMEELAKCDAVAEFKKKREEMCEKGKKIQEAHEREIAEVKKKNEELETQVCELRKLKGKLGDENTELRNRLVDLEEEVNNHLANIDELRKENRKLEDEKCKQEMSSPLDDTSSPLDDTANDSQRAQVFASSSNAAQEDVDSDMENRKGCCPSSMKLLSKLTDAGLKDIHLSLFAESQFYSLVYGIVKGTNCLRENSTSLTLMICQNYSNKEFKLNGSTSISFCAHEVANVLGIRSGGDLIEKRGEHFPSIIFSLKSSFVPDVANKGKKARGDPTKTKFGKTKRDLSIQSLMDILKNISEQKQQNYIYKKLILFYIVDRLLLPTAEKTYLTSTTYCSMYMPSDKAHTEAGLEDVDGPENINWAQEILNDIHTKAERFAKRVVKGGKSKSYFYGCAPVLETMLFERIEKLRPDPFEEYESNMAPIFKYKSRRNWDGMLKNLTQLDVAVCPNCVPPVEPEEQAQESDAHDMDHLPSLGFEAGGDFGEADMDAQSGGDLDVTETNVNDLDVSDMDHSSRSGEAWADFGVADMDAQSGGDLDVTETCGAGDKADEPLKVYTRKGNRRFEKMQGRVLKLEDDAKRLTSVDVSGVGNGERELSADEGNVHDNEFGNDNMEVPLRRNEDICNSLGAAVGTAQALSKGNKDAQGSSCAKGRLEAQKVIEIIDLEDDEDDGDECFSRKFHGKKAESGIAVKNEHISSSVEIQQKNSFSKQSLKMQKRKISFSNSNKSASSSLVGSLNLDDLPFSPAQLQAKRRKT